MSLLDRSSSTLIPDNTTSQNTFVGKLSEDKTYWIVSQAHNNVHRTENKTRMLDVGASHLPHRARTV